MNLFGFEIVRKSTEAEEAQKKPSFVDKENEDGAVVIAPSGAYGTFVDLDGTVRSEAELISKYREMIGNAEVGQAVAEIVNEMLQVEEEEPVKIDLSRVSATDPVKEAIQEAFDEVLDLMNFYHNGYEILRRWFVDGRFYYHIIIDETKTKEGVQELRYVDPRKIRKVREVIRRRLGNGNDGIGIEGAATETKAEYYIYNDRGFAVSQNQIQQGPVAAAATGIRIADDSVAQVTSGLTDVNGQMVLGYLQQAIKPLNQLRAVEDASVIYRLARAPERRVWYIDVGNLPKAKAEEYVRDIMTKHKNRLAYDARTGEYRDDRKFMCYALDTKIPLLDGRTLTLQEIMNEYEAGKKNWVYSCDPMTGKFVPGPVSWAGITKRSSDVVRVTFDNGESVVCTPDHKFPVWNKGLVEAKDLVGESVIPGYRRKKELAPGYKTEYEQIYKNDTKTWEFTHREVARWKDGVGIREEKLHSEKYTSEPKKTIHHVDYDRFNNSPENLVMMNRDDHLKYHRDCAKFGAGRRLNKKGDFTPIWRSRLSEAAKKRKPLCKTWKIRTPDDSELIVENLSKFCRENNLNRSNIKGRFGSRKYHAEQLRNHKAVSVEFLDERLDVGCLTVDLDETYHSHHTYLLDAGVYTKNTMLEDFWLPRREGGKGTQVETLPGGESLGEMDDVMYFQKKLYKSLSVPVSRLDSDNAFTLGRSTEITRDEVSFGKFVSRLRNRFGQLFTKVLGRHVVLKEIMSIEDWELISPKIRYDFAHDNYFMEMKDSEVQINRMDLLDRVSPYVGHFYSNEWVNRNILRLTEEEVEEIQEQIELEKSHPIYSQPVPGQEDPMMAGLDGMGPEEMPVMDDMGGPPMDQDPNAEGPSPDPNAAGGGPSPSPEKPKTQQRRTNKRKSHPG